MARPDSLARPAAAVARNVSGSQKNTRQFLLSGIFLPRERPGPALRHLNSCAMGLHVRVFVGEAYLGIFQLVQYFHVLI